MRLPNNIRSELTAKQLTELRRCVRIAFPTWARDTHYISLACSPAEAFRFMTNDAFTQE